MEQTPPEPAAQEMEQTPPEPIPAMKEPAVNPALSLTFAGMIESRAAALPGLEELITDQQRKRFVKKIFHRDADYYQTVITALEEMSGWEQASTYLMEFYRTNELDPFSGDVVEFTDIVQKRFQKGAS
jgi:hypothetical protein